MSNKIDFCQYFHKKTFLASGYAHYILNTSYVTNCSHLFKTCFFMLIREKASYIAHFP